MRLRRRGSSDDAGYDWFVPSAQGEDTLTPQVRELAQEILSGSKPAIGRERGRIRRWRHKIFDTKGDPIHLEMPPK